MHDFLSKQIEDCDPEAEMKEYLTYASAIDLEELEWFEHLPDTLQVRQALATYTYLASINWFRYCFRMRHQSAQAIRHD